MESEIFKLIAIQGGFAILFSYLLFYVLKENSKREDNYQSIIQELTELLTTIKKDVEDIKSNLNNKWKEVLIEYKSKCYHSRFLCLRYLNRSY